jgi:hypothetical protein
MAMGLNSNSTDDQIADLAKSVYGTLVADGLIPGPPRADKRPA